ncbi:MAG: ribonuclease PH, partial [Gemmataceae bacterium]
TRQSAGSVLVNMGRTMVLCTCCVEESVPPFLTGKGKGWLTAEYSMLPGSTGSRKARDKAGKVDGRSVEIQRLIGRALRAVVDLDRLGERTLWLDCDVLEADGGTRTAAINGAFVALVDALNSLQGKTPRTPSGSTTPPAPFPKPSDVIRDSVAAVSIGLLDDRALLDLCYEEDRDVDVDLNLIMTGGQRIIEVQAGGEEATFSREQLDELLEIGRRGIDRIIEAQRKVLGQSWPFASGKEIREKSDF